MSDVKNLPLIFSRESLHPAALTRAEQWLANSPGNAAWGVAFSGGADSLALLLTIRALWPAERARLVALHFNHRLRGAESDGDEAFCRALCAELGVSFRAGRWEQAKPGASEAEARAARLAFFAEEMRATGATLLWTGHQKDDVAETLLMRLARGSGAAGLSAPRPVQSLNDGRVFLRPLLSLTKEAIAEKLRVHGLTWREDASNEHGGYFRNRVRREVMTAWKNAAPNDAPGGAALTRELLEEDDVALEAWLDELCPKNGYGSASLDIRPLRGRPRALLRRALRRWTPLAELGRAGFEHVLALAEREAGHANATNGIVENRDGVLVHLPRGENTDEPVAWPEATLAEGVTLVLPDGAVVTRRAVIFDEELRAKILSGGVDPTREVYLVTRSPELRVRTWRSGDRFRPLGAPGSGKLQDQFVNRKIPVNVRGVLPLVIDDGGTILWIPGFPPAEESKLTDDSVKGVHLTYETGTYTVRP